MAQEIAQARQEGSQTVRERPPVGESQSNGMIERTLGLVAGQARTLKAALERWMGVKVSPDARILCWLVEFAAYLMHRFGNGKAPLHRLDGRRGNTSILEFGAKVLYMPAKPTSKRRNVGATIPPRSVCWHTELVVGSSGCHQARAGDQDSCRNHQKWERWDADRILGMRAVLWPPDGTDNAFDSQVGMERPAEVVPRSTGEVGVRGFHAREHFQVLCGFGLGTCFCRRVLLFFSFLFFFFSFLFFSFLFFSFRFFSFSFFFSFFFFLFSLFSCLFSLFSFLFSLFSFLFSLFSVLFSLFSFSLFLFFSFSLFLFFSFSLFLFFSFLSPDQPPKVYEEVTKLPTSTTAANQAAASSASISAATCDPRHHRTGEPLHECSRGSQALVARTEEDNRFWPTTNLENQVLIPTSPKWVTK